ncbi:MAG TPA: primosomal protein N' [Chthoniobacterales bacterium]|nr:primosomal protein N' [Chthoniobacterales bacterium]
MQRYARVITDDPTDKELDYSIPPAWAGKVQIGSRVKVPLRSREILATVVALVDTPSVPNAKNISALISESPVLNNSLLTLARWMANYYCCPVESAVRSLLPEVIRTAKLGFKQERVVSATREISETELGDFQKKAPRQAHVLRAAIEVGIPIRWRELQQNARTTDRTIQHLVDRGLLRVDLEKSERDPYANESFIPSVPMALNSDQKRVLDLVVQSVDAKDYRPILLHGITGSGKTEIYLQAIDHCLKQGFGALVLVPEISLTPQTVERFKMRFQVDLIAVLHSHLSAGERHDEWHKLNTGKARVAIGARSAVFAPVQRLGLIVIDEEHENSYKQEEMPRYHARDLAVVRAQIDRCAILLGSATPSLESYQNARTGKYRLALLTSRVDDRQLPLIRVIDMRQEYLKQKHIPLISGNLANAIEARLAAKEQTILFLNRRGFATSLVCSQCGFVCDCPNCSVALTFHQGENRLKCHLCGHTSVAPRKCPKCSDPSIRYSGYGTEKIEGTVRKLFPSATVARMDADSMTRKDAYRQTLREFRTGKIDILVGTQMIAKGLDFPNVTLVGIINADVGLYMPDFRAGERTFQLLTQVAGRAGRGDMAGEVFVQSSTPFSPSIQFARHHNFEGFFEQEIEIRERCDYPPFIHLLMIHVRSEHQRLAEFTAETLHRRISEQIDAGVTLHAVVSAPIERSKGFYRYQILLRTNAIRRLSNTIRAIIDKLTFPEEVRVAVDVDPYQLL